MYNGSSRSPSGLRYHVKLANPLRKSYSEMRLVAQNAFSSFALGTQLKACVLDQKRSAYSFSSPYAPKH